MVGVSGTVKKGRIFHSDSGIATMPSTWYRKRCENLPILVDVLLNPRKTFPRTRTDLGQNSPRRTYGERTRSEWEWDKNQVASAADPRKAKKVSWASVVKFGIGNNSAAANEIEHPHSVQSRSTNNVL